MRTLFDWYATGADVQARLPLLSTYLGRASPASTYYYLERADRGSDQLRELQAYRRRAGPFAA